MSWELVEISPINQRNEFTLGNVNLTKICLYYTEGEAVRNTASTT